MLLKRSASQQQAAFVLAVPIAIHHARLPSSFTTSAPYTSPHSSRIVCSLLQTSKNTLLQAVSSLRLGRAALGDMPRQRQVQTLIESLECANPTDQPALSPLLNGTWELVYTDSASTLGADRPRVLQSNTLLQTLSLTGREDGEENGTFTIEERGTIPLLGRYGIGWRNLIGGTCKAAQSEEQKRRGCQRLVLKFEWFKVGGVWSIKFPGPALGWQDLTFLDEGMRIARTNKGNIMVMRRRP